KRDSRRRDVTSCVPPPPTVRAATASSVRSLEDEGASPDLARRRMRWTGEGGAGQTGVVTEKSKPLPQFRFLTPRTLPPASHVPRRVAVLDIAFASEGGGTSFQKVTLPFIEGLGVRLAAWVDHHDHDRHTDY